MDFDDLRKFLKDNLRIEVSKHPAPFGEGAETLKVTLFLVDNEKPWVKEEIDSDYTFLEYNN